MRQPLTRLVPGRHLPLFIASSFRSVKLQLVLAVAILLIIGCNSPTTGRVDDTTTPTTTLSEQDAIQTVLESNVTVMTGLMCAVGDNPTFPDRSGVVDCTLSMSAGDLSVRRIPARCGTGFCEARLAPGR